jgi:Zn-dependent metalloprotease
MLKKLFKEESIMAQELTIFDVGVKGVEVKKEEKSPAKNKSTKGAGTKEKVAAKKVEKKPEVKVNEEWTIHFATERFQVTDFVEEISEEGITLEELRAEMEKTFNQFTASRTKWDIDEENKRLYPDSYSGSKGGL